MTTVSETLNTAADLIEKRGWVSGIGGWPTVDRDGAPLCLEGGIMAALGFVYKTDADFLPVLACPAYEAVRTYLNLAPDVDEGGWPVEPLWGWNDEYDRTAAEVIEVLRAAAVIEAARENESAAAEALR